METTKHSADKSLGLWLGKPAPRYTSYPPAPAFHTGVGSAGYAAAIKAIGAEEPVSVYVHIPFCRMLCLYCGCNTAVTNRASRIDSYIEALKVEAARVAQHASHPLTVSHLHFGGGTPNVLNPDEWLSLMAHLRACYDLGSVREVAVEIDPRIATRQQIEAMAASGVTRISLGIQDFDAHVQEAVQRIQPLEMVDEVCGWIRQSGIGGINFDLMYGLPLQTIDSVAITTRRAAGLAPDRISLFSYAHVPALKKHQKALEAHPLPTVHERLAMDEVARKTLKQAGYVEIGIDHFARPEDSLTAAMREGRLHRNFQGYTDDRADTLIALGASSISQTRDGFFQNDHHEGGYMAAIRAGGLAVKRGYLSTAEDRLRSTIIARLMCELSCDIGAVCEATGSDARQFDADLAALAPFEQAGLVRREGRRITLTTPYRMAVRVIAAQFDTHTARLRSTSSVAA